MALVRLWYATILDIKSPLEFSVRLATAEEDFFFFKERLNERYSRHCSSLKLVIVQAYSLKAGDNVVVFYDSRWSRALVQSTQHEYQVEVWLLDYGQTIVMEMDELYTLDDDFYKIKPFAIRCHLANLEEVVTPHWLMAATQKMENMKEHYGDEVQIVQIEPTDENVIFNDKNGGWFKSLPVNVLWVYTESSPLEPSVQKNVNLLDNLKIMEVFEPFDDDELMDSLTEAADLLTTSDDTVSSKRAVEKVENDPNFRWLNPEIPSQRRFLARCSHVDDSGQIYLQLESNKSRINSVHDDLATKYMGSRNDGITLKEGSECIARPYARFKTGPPQHCTYVENSSSTSKRWEENSHGVGFAIARTSTSNSVQVSSKPVEASLPRNLPFPVPEDLLQHAQVGDRYKCKLASVVAYNNVFVHPVVDELVVAGVPGPPSNLSSLAIRYNHMWKQLQEEAPCMPPVINPTKGLPVAARFKVEGSQEKLWYRGVIHDGLTCEIIFVDLDGVPFSVESKEVVRLPEFAESVPVIGMEIELGVVADDEEVSTVVMGEFLWKQEDPLFVQLISTNPRVAHIVDTAGKPVYSSLQEKGFVFLKTEDDVLLDLQYWQEARGNLFLYKIG